MSERDLETTDRILKEERIFMPSPEMVSASNVMAYARERGFSDLEQLYVWAADNYEEFWEDMASRLHWFRPWDGVLRWECPDARWFEGGSCNIVYNCLDRYMEMTVRNKVAFYWEGENGARKIYSYSRLYDEVNRLSSALVRMGIGKGDRVAIYLPRIPEQVVAMLATARIGAVHTLIYSGLSEKALAERMQDAEARLVITADGYYYRGNVVELKAVVDRAIRYCPSVERIMVVRRTKNRVMMVTGRDVYLDEAVALADRYQPCAEMDAEDPLFILYTSGTTGKPKGVVHVHGGYMVGAFATTRLVLDLRPEDVYWCTADPGWITGHTYIVYGPLLNGATQLIYEGAVDYPDPARLYYNVDAYGVSVLYTAPTAVRALMHFGEAWPSKFSMERVRLLGSVGEPINPEAWVWYRRAFGDRCPIMDTWWQTETGMHMITPLVPLPLKPGSAGRPFLGQKAEVVDAEGNPVPPGKGGYLVLLNPWPSMMRAIHGDREKYESYWNRFPGKYFAGDAATVDEDGYFWIQGRVDDVIKKAGYRLGSMEIESALVSHEAVAEAAAIGLPDEVKGERIKALVVLTQGTRGSDYLADRLRDHVRSTMGVIAVPDEIAFVDSLPKTRSGKIMRRLLKARELGQEVGDLSTLEE
ncbi:acetate--CoA ligase [Candidatus Solincola sp.]